METEKNVIINTPSGSICGNVVDDCMEFLGIPFAVAGRFEYANLLENWGEDPRCKDGVFHATGFGPACPQYRQYFPHLDNPERKFYQREFREGLSFEYDEDCLNLNIYAPEGAENCPVVLFFHGGGFNSGSNSEEPFRAYEFAKRGLVTVVANYRVGVLGYLTHSEIYKKYGRDGNFGLDDQRTALLWVKKNISAFGGDPENITLLGQSAGAISIQYLCLDHNNEGLFRRAAMMSGGGMFPKFALPKKVEDNREYWLTLMKTAGCDSFEQLKSMDIKALLAAEEELKTSRKDTIYYTMPVVDGYLLKEPVDKLINNPLNIDYMIGYTNNDMYASVMAWIGNKFGRKNEAYIYYFDIDSPGDENGAFHSADLRYMFGRLEQSWRPYGERDYEVSRQLMDYFASFARSGDPNGEGRPYWNRCSRSQKSVLCFRKDKTEMGRASYFKLVKNMLSKGNPKA